jgi:hypothetical protein
LQVGRDNKTLRLCLKLGREGRLQLHLRAMWFSRLEVWQGTAEEGRLAM